MNIWPFRELDQLKRENAVLRTDMDTCMNQIRSFNERDLETEHVTALNAQNAILGEKARQFDKMCEDHRRLRLVVKEIFPRDLEIAEELNTNFTDLVIWLLREKPGVGMPQGKPEEGA